MDALEVIEHKGYQIEVHLDDDPTSPRDWDNAGTMVCWHRRSILGDEQPKVDPDDWFRCKLGGECSEVFLENATLKELILKFQKHNLLIPIMAYEHGGITIRAYDYGTFPDQRWDCGQLGFIYVSHEDIMKEWGGKHIGKKNLENARRCLLSEISTYDDYLTGQVYGYILKGPDGEDLGDSCWGFYGKQYMIDECKSNIDARIEQKEAEAAEQALLYDAAVAE